MPSHRAIRKPRMGASHSARRILTASASSVTLRQPAAGHLVKVEDAGGGMADLTVSERLPRSVVERISRLLREGAQPAAPPI